jgi:hypothetical protein
MTKKKDETWVFSAEMIRLAAIWRAPHEKHPEASFIHAEPHPKGGAVVLGTDGHAMLVAYDRKAKCPSACNLALPADALANLEGATTISRTVRGTRDKFVIEEGEDSTEYQHPWILPGVWLNWLGALPTEDQFNLALSYQPRVLNATYLKRIGMMYDTMTDERQVHFCTKGIGDSVIIFFPWNRDVFLVLAPMQGERIRLTFPDWLPAMTAKEWSLDDAAADL